MATFRQRGKLTRDDMAGAWWLVGASMAGAVLGTYIATTLGKRQMELAIGVVMVIILITIFVNPKKWLREKSELQDGRPSLGRLGLFFVIGAYGGFVQAGVGVFLLTALVLGVGYTLVEANIVKLVIVLMLTLVALVVFIISPVEINWGIGLLMSVGQMIGAWAAALFATRVPNANVWVRRLLIVVVIYSILRFFGILDLILA
ncbi:MAG: sulfite exporter TauE/SafE family protein [Caldilineae bacterium]|nr:MAG: sulfite exporter TauE/SafE family protein [Caldilineae bacterium]